MKAIQKAIAYDVHKANHYAALYESLKRKRNHMDFVTKFWMVKSVDEVNPIGGCYAASSVHATAALAASEATRLAKANPGKKFAVMESTKVFEATVTVGSSNTIDVSSAPKTPYTGYPSGTACVTSLTGRGADTPPCVGY